MKDANLRTNDGRRIVHLSGDLLPAGGLYRVAFGNGSYDSEPADLSCSWDGERPGRLYAYHSTGEDAVQKGDADYVTEVYCGLH